MVSTGYAAAANPHHGRKLLPKPSAHTSAAPKPEPKSRSHVGLACDHCRLKKIKCDGKKPQCTACVMGDVSCNYGLPRKQVKDRLLKDKEILVALAKNLRLTVTDIERTKIDKVLQEIGENTADLPVLHIALSPHETAPEGVNHLTHGNQNGRAALASEIPPPAILNSSTRTDQNSRLSLEPQQLKDSESPQPLEVDVIGDSPMGSDSPTQQPRPIEVEGADLTTQTASAYSPPELNGVFDVKTLYPDENCTEPYIPVNPGDLPSTLVAETLIEHYREGMHKWLPILSPDFETQVLGYHMHADAVPSRCLAIMNLVFAIGAQYALLVNNAQCLVMDDSLEHRVYMSRALQSLDSRASPTWASKPDIAVVQTAGLIATYHLVTGNLQRAWFAVGCAIRFAVALELHSLPTPDDESNAERQILTRTWWSLRYLDHMLSSALQRPTTIPNEECASPKRNQPHDSQSYPWLAAQLTIISLAAVRSATLHGTRYSGLQTDDWRSILKIDLSKLQESVRTHESILLSLSWHDAMILVTRPSSYSGTQYDNKKPLDSVLPTRECTNAALGLTRLLSDKPAIDFFQAGPWWSFVHYVLRALSVLLPVAVHPLSQKESHSQAIIAVEKLISWLRWLSDKDRIALTALRPILHAMGKNPIWAGSKITADRRECGTGISGSLCSLDEWGFSASDPLYSHLEVSADQLASLSTIDPA